MYNKIIEKLKNKNIAILGFGKEGKSTYNFIRRYLEQPLTILDKNDIIKNNEFLLEDKNTKIITKVIYFGCNNDPGHNFSGWFSGFLITLFTNNVLPC